MSRDPKIRDGTSWECFHGAYEIDRLLRTVRCGKCGEDVDAFQALLEIHSQEAFHEMHRRDADKLAERVAFLKGEERRVKARVLRASRKDAEMAVAEERAKWVERFRRVIWQSGELRRQVEKLVRTIGEAEVEAALKSPPPAGR